MIKHKNFDFFHQFLTTRFVYTFAEGQETQVKSDVDKLKNEIQDDLSTQAIDAEIFKAPTAADAIKVLSDRVDQKAQPLLTQIQNWQEELINPGWMPFQVRPVSSGERWRATQEAYNLQAAALGEAENDLKNFIKDQKDALQKQETEYAKQKEQIDNLQSTVLTGHALLDENDELEAQLKKLQEKFLEGKGDASDMANFQSLYDLMKENSLEAEKIQQEVQNDTILAKYPELQQGVGFFSERVLQDKAHKSNITSVFEEAKLAFAGKNLRDLQERRELATHEKYEADKKVPKKNGQLDTSTQEYRAALAVTEKLRAIENEIEQAGEAIQQGDEIVHAPVEATLEEQQRNLPSEQWEDEDRLRDMIVLLKDQDAIPTLQDIRELESYRNELYLSSTNTTNRARRNDILKSLYQVDEVFREASRRFESKSNDLADAGKAREEAEEGFRTAKINWLRVHENSSTSSNEREDAEKFLEEANERVETTNKEYAAIADRLEPEKSTDEINAEKFLAKHAEIQKLIQETDEFLSSISSTNKLEDLVALQKIICDTVGVEMTPVPEYLTSQKKQLIEAMKAIRVRIDTAIGRISHHYYEIIDAANPSIKKVGEIVKTGGVPLQTDALAVADHWEKLEKLQDEIARFPELGDVHKAVRLKILQLMQLDETTAENIFNDPFARKAKLRESYHASEKAREDLAKAEDENAGNIEELRTKSVQARRSFDLLRDRVYAKIHPTAGLPKGESPTVHEKQKENTEPLIANNNSPKAQDG